MMRTSLNLGWSVFAAKRPDAPAPMTTTERYGCPLIVWVELGPVGWVVVLFVAAREKEMPGAPEEVAAVSDCDEGCMRFDNKSLL